MQAFAVKPLPDLLLVACNEAMTALLSLWHPAVAGIRICQYFIMQAYAYISVDCLPTSKHATSTGLLIDCLHAKRLSVTVTQQRSQL